MVAVTIAIAGHLIQNGTGLGGSFVGSHLSRGNHALVCKLLLREDGRLRGAGLGRRWMKRGNLSSLVHELSMRHTGGKKNSEHT